MTFDEWARTGINNGWCGPAVCATHDGLPMTLDEEDADEPCVYIIRLYENDNQSSTPTVTMAETMTIPAVQVGRQRGEPDAQWCWSDRCWRTPNPGIGTPPLGLCPACATELVPAEQQETPQAHTPGGFPPDEHTG